MHTSSVLLLLVSAVSSVLGQFDFGGGGTSCDGSGTFQQQIQLSEAVLVGDIPVGLQGLEIRLESDQDVDIQLVDDSGTKIINWVGGVLNGPSTMTRKWNGDWITYSGYNGGKEYVSFQDETSNSYTLYVFGYAAGYATVTYSWKGQVGCSNNGPATSGSGSFLQDVAKDQVVTVDLPAGLSDLYVRLDSNADIDIQLYDGDVSIINYQDGLLQDSQFERKSYNGLEIEYSGYLGEQRSDAFGKEYIYISGTLPGTLSLKVLGYDAGSADVTYNWGYYESARGLTGNSLQNALHNTIDGHTELSYSQVWDALKRTDQDPDNTDNMLVFYSRLSVPKSEKDNGSNGNDAWNREHVWPKSHGDYGTSQGPGTDIHALRASDKSVNSERGNKDFDNGGSALSSTEPAEDCPQCLETNQSFEPPDAVKGAVARMIFYMALRYNGDVDSNGISLNIVDTVGTPFGSSTDGDGHIGKLSTLKAWNKAYPPSAEEYRRNNIIFDIQGNRNPFIDHPEWVDSIF